MINININNVTFRVDNSFKPIYWDWISKGNWEPQTFTIIDFFVHPGHTVLDLGCWAGPVSFYMSAKGAKVHAVDPDPEAYKSFLVNLSLNIDLKKHIYPYNLAISASNGKIPLYARKGYGDSSTSILNRTRDEIDHFSVRGCTLDHFVKENEISKIDFIKMDIEGGEFEVISSSLPTIQQLEHPTIFISLHYAQLNEHIYRNTLSSKKIVLSLMKIEEILSFKLFRKKLLEKLDSIVLLAKQYRFVYDEKGTLIPLENLTSTYLHKNKPNLLLTNREWNP